MVDSNLTPTPNLTNRFTASRLGSLICYDLFAMLVSCSSCVIMFLKDLFELTLYNKLENEKALTFFLL